MTLQHFKESTGEGQVDFLVITMVTVKMQTLFLSWFMANIFAS